MKRVLITGCSSGLGEGLTKYYLENNYEVYGISRREFSLDNKNFHHFPYDLSNTQNIKKDLQEKIQAIGEVEIVYLNAGTLGNIKEMTQQDLEKEIKPVLELNLWANKELLDILSEMEVSTIIGISSGAAVNGSFGWGAYSMSKASLNMLINLYGKEMYKTKLLAIAPGVIKTPMTDIIVNDVDDTIYTSAKRLKEGEIQTPEFAAKRLGEVVKDLKRFKSGSFIDVRDI